MFVFFFLFLRLGKNQKNRLIVDVSILFFDVYKNMIQKHHGFLCSNIQHRVSHQEHVARYSRLVARMRVSVVWREFRRRHSLLQGALGNLGGGNCGGFQQKWGNNKVTQLLVTQLFFG